MNRLDSGGWEELICCLCKKVFGVYDVADSYGLTPICLECAKKEI